MPSPKAKKKKRWTGVRTARKRRPELVGDSYQADKKDLKTIRNWAKKKGISKAEIVRYGVKLAIMVFNARESGDTSFTFKLTPPNDA